MEMGWIWLITTMPASTGSDEIAFVDEADTGAAVERRGDAGVVEDGLRVGDGGGVGADLRFELGDLSLLGVDGLLCDDAFCDRLKTLEVALGVGELRLCQSSSWRRPGRVELCRWSGRFRR